jgi:hypothetical protein
MTEQRSSTKRGLLFGAFDESFTRSKIDTAATGALVAIRDGHNNI